QRLRAGLIGGLLKLRKPAVPVEYDVRNFDCVPEAGGVACPCLMTHQRAADLILHPADRPEYGIDMDAGFAVVPFVSRPPIVDHLAVLCDLRADGCADGARNFSVRINVDVDI